jgi:hypothetical protein
MKKSQLKQVLKPIIAECIKESLLEDGLLSNVISEVFKGLSQQTIVETKQQKPVNIVENKEKVTEEQQVRQEASHHKLDEYRKSLLDNIGSESYGGIDVFEGTTPIPAESGPGQALSGVDPGDPGADISKLFGNSNKHRELLERMNN